MMEARSPHNIIERIAIHRPHLFKEVVVQLSFLLIVKIPLLIRRGGCIATPNIINEWPYGQPLT